MTGVEEPGPLAQRLLVDLAVRLGPALDSSRAQGRVLADHGPALMAAYDDYRSQLGLRADAAVFRGMVQRLFGVDLTPAPPAGSTHR